MSGVLLTAMACAGAQPKPCPYGGSAPCPTCRPADELAEAGEIAPVPSLRESPAPSRVLFWSGEQLPPEMPEPHGYVRCRACGCGEDGQLAPWDDWQAINRRAYARLRESRAPYPVAIVPGFHGGGFIASYRLKIGLKLLRRGWVSALIVSGGHMRGGRNEARFLYERAHQLAASYQVDVTDRIFIEPCACKTITNLRNSLRMMAALGISHGLLISDAQMSGQAAVFSTNLDGLIEKDLGCPVGRVSYLMGYTPWGRWDDSGNGCRAPVTLTNNPMLFLLPNRRLAIFWVSPTMTIGDEQVTALQCGGGAERLVSCEPDNQDPLTAGCLPAEGHGDLACEP